MKVHGISSLLCSFLIQVWEVQLLFFTGERVRFSYWSCATQTTPIYFVLHHCIPLPTVVLVELIKKKSHNYLTPARTLSNYWINRVPKTNPTPHSCTVTLPEQCWCPTWKYPKYLTFIGPCIVIYSYSKTKQMNQCLELFIFAWHFTRFGRPFHPSSGVQDYIQQQVCVKTDMATCLLAESEFHLVPASKQVAISVWHMPVAVCTVLNSWWWTERPSKT
jgi:hypothetical protein